MILLFEISGVPLLVGVSEDSKRVLSVAAPITKFVFVPIRKLNRFKKFNVSEFKALDDTNRIVKELEDLKAVRRYVLDELFKLGATFKRELSADDYLAWFESLKKG